MSSSKRGHNTALQRYLHSGVRSVEDVRRYLRQRGVGQEAAETLIAEAQACGALDDRACARLLADHWAQAGYAWRAIREKLLARGLPEKTIAVACREVNHQEDDRQRAQRLLAQRQWQQADRGRQARRLAARGFESDLIEHVLGGTVDYS